MSVKTNKTELPEEKLRGGSGRETHHDGEGGPIDREHALDNLKSNYKVALSRDDAKVIVNTGVKSRKGARKDPKILYEYVYYDQKINSILSLPATLNGQYYACHARKSAPGVQLGLSELQLGVNPRFEESINQAGVDFNEWELVTCICAMQKLETSN
ncbi:hypothetical protein DY000_02059857 [Brassica cretica]|uniref:Uncharacterized protein n=1 Tax=Brassica cretica TaxID=69181 RepID=A0ABQ7AYZ8_BRACR|nr:hypothetical protein DY000_02059857 [Brassica cretica]